MSEKEPIAIKEKLQYLKKLSISAIKPFLIEWCTWTKVRYGGKSFENAKKEASLLFSGKGKK